MNFPSRGAFESWTEEQHQSPPQRESAAATEQAGRNNLGAGERVRGTCTRMR